MISLDEALAGIASATYRRWIEHDTPGGNWSRRRFQETESKLCTVDTMLTRHFYVESRERLSEAISNASKNMSSRIKNA